MCEFEWNIESWPVKPDSNINSGHFTYNNLMFYVNIQNKINSSKLSFNVKLDSVHMCEIQIDATVSISFKSNTIQKKKILSFNKLKKLDKIITDIPLTDFNQQFRCKPVTFTFHFTPVKEHEYEKMPTLQMKTNSRVTRKKSVSKMRRLSNASLDGNQQDQTIAPFPKNPFSTSKKNTVSQNHNNSVLSRKVIKNDQNKQTFHKNNHQNQLVELKISPINLPNMNQNLPKPIGSSGQANAIKNENYSKLPSINQKQISYTKGAVNLFDHNASKLSKNTVQTLVKSPRNQASSQKSSKKVLPNIPLSSDKKELNEPIDDNHEVISENIQNFNENNNFAKSKLADNQDNASNDPENSETVLSKEDHIEELKIEPEEQYSGLKNQGATCYMNSVLQSLFHIPLFRKTVYEIPTENENDKVHSIPLNLQAIFFNMQNSSMCNPMPSITTKYLTKSFGWDSTEAFVQHDMQEFMRILLTKLEEKSGNNDISNIFKGKTISTISGKSVEFKSANCEDFYDLSLTVKDCHTLENSFKEFTKIEDLSDSYDAGEQFGKIAVQIQLQILQLPKVLQLHLRRFEYDFVHDSLVKINEELSFPQTFDITPYLHPDSPHLLNQSETNKERQYFLVGIIAHNGDAFSGHYYVYLRPKIDSSFFLFNDENVRKVSDEEAINFNFGGYDASLSTPNNYDSMRRHSAYMLIYSRMDCLNELYNVDFNIPNYIKDYAKDQIVVNKSPSKNKIRIYYLTEDALRRNSNELRGGLYNEKEIYNCFISSDTTTERLYQIISSNIKVDVNSIRLWQLDAHYKIIKPIIPSKNEYSCQYNVSHIFVQEKLQNDPFEIEKDEIILFFKLYTRRNECPLLFFGSIIFSIITVVKNIKNYIINVLNLNKDSNNQDENNPKPLNIKLFVESSSPNSSIKEIVDDDTKLFKISNLNSGSSIIVQMDEDHMISNELYHMLSYELEDNANDLVISFSNIFNLSLPNEFLQYIEYKKNLVKLEVFDYDVERNLGNNTNDIKQSFGIVEFPENISLTEFTNFMTIAFNFNLTDQSERILFFRYSKALKGPAPFPINNMSEVSRIRYRFRKIYCLVTSISEGITINIQYSEDSYHLSKKMFLFMPLKIPSETNSNSYSSFATVGDVLSIFNTGDSFIRALHVKNNLIVKKLDYNDTIDIFADSLLRFEKVPSDEIEYQKEKDLSKLSVKEINVCHAIVNKESCDLSFIDFPFLLYVKEDETFETTKNRISKYLHIGDDRINHIRFIIIDNQSMPTFSQDKVLKKEQKLYDIIKESNPTKNGNFYNEELLSAYEQILVLLHSSEESFRLDYGNLDLQIH